MPLKQVPTKRSDPESFEPRDSKLRAKVTNCADMLPGVDQRSVAARRFRDIVSAIIQDQGGLDACSEARVQLVRRFSAACVMAENLETLYCSGKTINIAEHALLCSTLVRTANKIGIGRRAKNITPSLADILSPPIEPVKPPHDSDPFDSNGGKPISDPQQLAEREAMNDDDD